MGTQRFVQGLRLPYYWTHGSISSRALFPLGDPPPSETSPTVYIAGRKPINVCTQGMSFSAPCWLQQILILCGTDESSSPAAIDVLPDDVLLDIFDFYRNNHNYSFRPAWKWHILVHVCQRWRHVAFASPQRLKIQVLCTFGTPVRKNLGIWPAFPIILNFFSLSQLSPGDEDNVIAALEYPNRVCSVRLNVTGLQLGRMVTLMQEPFPLLTRLFIVSRDAPVIPSEFLGDSAPCLQEITFSGIPFPALPALLLSTRDLVTLTLKNIPLSGYISPSAMAAGLAALPRLERFTIEFQSAAPLLDQIRPPPVPPRTVLPSLTFFHFQGGNNYLEDLVSQLDGPQLNEIDIVYLDPPVDFQVPRLSTFIERSVGPELTPSSRAHVCFRSDEVDFTLYRHSNCPGWDRHPVRTTISSDAFNLQVSDLAQVLSRFSATLFAVVHLELDAQLEDDYRLERTNVVEWLHIFRQFPAVQTLHVSWRLTGFIALALNGIRGETVAEVLPFLELICLEGQMISFIEKFNFFADRRLSDRPVSLVATRKEFDKRLEFYIGK